MTSRIILYLIGHHNRLGPFVLQGHEGLASTLGPNPCSTSWRNPTWREDFIPHLTIPTYRP